MRGQILLNLGVPVTSSSPAAPPAWPCRSVLGQLEGVGWAWALSPDDWTGAARAPGPGPKEGEGPHVSSQAPPLPVTVFGVETD